LLYCYAYERLSLIIKLRFKLEMVVLYEWVNTILSITKRWLDEEIIIIDALVFYT